MMKELNIKLDPPKLDLEALNLRIDKIVPHGKIVSIDHYYFFY
jgi:hypothetical protein